MGINFCLKDVFNPSAIGTYLETRGEEIMASAPGLLGGACVTGLLALGATATFGLSAAFAVVALTTPASFYGIGISMKMLGKGMNHITRPIASL
jgi:hypothetical protein